MPSSGSTTQRSPELPVSSPPSSPRNPSSGRAAAIRERIRSSAAWSAAETRSVGVLLASTVDRRAGERLEQLRARLAGDALRELAQLRAHGVAGGRWAGQSRSRSSCAASESSTPSPSGGRDELHASAGSRRRAKPAGTAAAGCPVWLNTGG